MYPIGTIKVAWVEKDVEYLSSDMFKPDELDKAVALGESVGDYMIMQLIEQSKDYYRWRVLPYGRHKQYIKGMKLTRKVENLFNSESGFDGDELDNESGFVQIRQVTTQEVRLIDVFIIAPLLIYTSTQKTLPFWLRMALLIMGITTLLYNGDNYLKNRDNK
jgi:hypothetical protein